LGKSVIDTFPYFVCVRLEYFTEFLPSAVLGFGAMYHALLGPSPQPSPFGLASSTLEESFPFLVMCGKIDRKKMTTIYLVGGY